MDAVDSRDLIRRARTDAGLTQEAVAAAVGIRQSNLAAIESGRRTASSEMIENILAAVDYRPSIPVGFHRDEIRALGSQFGISNIRVFGSVARGDDHRNSDIDLLVDVDSTVAPFGLGAFASYVEELVGFPVDVVVDSGNSAAILSMRKTAVPL